MKKIYMILAAITLLSMSLNAQLLPENKLGGFDFTPTGTAYYKATNGQFRMPSLASDEYLFGPYITDDFDQTGATMANFYNNDQWVTATVRIPQSEYQDHIGDTIIGFRFALAGSNSVNVQDFGIYPSSQGWYSNVQRKIWNLGEMFGGSTASHTETKTAHGDITINISNGNFDFRRIAVETTSGTTVTEWNYVANNTNLPNSNWTASNTILEEDNNSYWMSGGGTITIKAAELAGVTDPVRVVIYGKTYNYQYRSSTVTVNGSAQSITNYSTWTNYTWGSFSPTTTTLNINTVEVGNGNVRDEELPAYGYWHDRGYKNQMIYRAEQLSMASGASIRSLTFYPEDGIPFAGSTVTVSLANTSAYNFGTASYGDMITSDLTTVASFVPAEDHDATAWTINFDTPFTYTGGNLVVQVACPGYVNDHTNGQFGHCYFLGDNQSSNVSIKVSGKSAASAVYGPTSKFLPKATFGFTGSVNTYSSMTLQGGQWHDFFLDEPVVFEFTGDSIINMNIGYTYYQPDDNSFAPVAYNSNSTGHTNVFYMYAQSGTPTTTTGNATVANGTTTNSTIPANGYYQDYGYRDQMIYTSSLLSAQGLQDGDQITSLTFYPSAGIKFYGSTIKISLGNTTTNNFGTSSSTSASMITSGLTQVASLRLTAANTSATEWTFTFDQPFTYNGQNLIVQVQCEGYTHDGTNGQYDSSGNRTNFYGQNQSAYQSNSTYGTYSTTGQNNTSGTNSQFLPKAKFDYSRTSSSYQRRWWTVGSTVPGDLAAQLIFKKAKEKTPTPTISVSTPNGQYVVVTATADPSTPNAQVTLTANGQTVTGTGTVQIILGQTDNDYSVTAVATAQETGMLVSDPASETFTVTASWLDPSPTPTIDSEVLDLSVKVTGDGQGTVHMYVDGQEVTYPDYYLERGDQQYTVTVTITAQTEDHRMTTTTATVVVPPLANIEQLIDGWTQLPGTYNDSKVINWNDYVMFVDRFTESTANNDQPTRYVYKMTENDTKLIRPLKETNEHIIPVQTTESKVFGYFTEEQVIADIDRMHVDTCVMNADVQMYLEKNSDIYYYTLDRSRNSILDDNFLELSFLQNDGAKYVEFDEYFVDPQPLIIGETGINIHRFDTINPVLPASAPQGVDGKHYGNYDNRDYIAYVPIIWTFGNHEVNERAFWDRDHKHNSYGSPIWKTSVGKVNLIGQPKLERQDGKDGSTNWEEIVGNDTIPCSIYMITDLTAHGFLPNPEVSNIKYEPYMFRVWVMSDTTFLRRFEWVDGDPDDIYQRPGTHFEGRGTIPANEPFIVWEEYIADSTTNISYDGIHPDMTIFHKSKIEDWATDTTGDVHFVTPQDMNMLFAAQDNLTSSHLTIFVRFYYKSTGEGLYQNQNNNQNGMLLMANRAGGGNSFYGVEGEGDPDPDIPTFIKGVYTSTDHGEVVSTTYYNLQGMQSSQPFQGINIVVTRYSDGTYSTQKVMRR